MYSDVLLLSTFHLHRHWQMVPNDDGTYAERNWEMNSFANILRRRHRSRCICHLHVWQKVSTAIRGLPLHVLLPYAITYRSRIFICLRKFDVFMNSLRTQFSFFAFLPFFAPLICSYCRIRMLFPFVVFFFFFSFNHFECEFIVLVTRHVYK